MNQEKVGKFIKELRKNNKMTQSQFAEKYNVTYQAVSNWEKGKNLPDISLIKQISKDFNVSVDDLLNGKNESKNNSNKYYVFIIIILIIISCLFLFIILINKNKPSYNFKTLSSSCENFNISGSLSYDSKKASIFITNVNYCGGDDNTEYSNIECILYESNGNTEIKISSCNYDKSESINLENFLKDVQFTVDNYYKTCKIYTNNNLYLRINATDYNGKTTTYKIPLSLNDECNK